MFKAFNLMVSNGEWNYFYAFRIECNFPTIYSSNDFPMNFLRSFARIYRFSCDEII